MIRMKHIDKIYRHVVTFKEGGSTTLVKLAQYFRDGSRTGKQYKHEMSDKDHERLLQVLLRHTGPVLISGYDNEIYRDMLRAWHLETQMEYCRANKRRTECLWMNFEPEGQMKMF